jgi:hypothetical protein
MFYLMGERGIRLPSRLSAHPVVDGRYGRVDAALVGEKAAQLLRLYELSLQCDFSVPKFCILPTTVLRDYYRNEGWDPLLDYPVLPHPRNVPRNILSGLLSFPTYAGEVIDACLGRLERPAMLRTSLVRPDGDIGTGYGTNATVLLDADQSAAVRHTRVIPRLLAELYKAYTTWDTWSSRPWAERQAAVIMMDAVPFSCLGAAYVQPDRVTVEIDRKLPLSREHRVLRRGTREPAVAHGAIGDSVLGSRKAERLMAACQNIWDARSGPTDLIEVEFGFGYEDELFVVQARELPDCKAGAFHSVGEVSGPVCDLRTVPRDLESVRDALSRVEPRSVVVLPRTGSDAFDLFALAWIWRGARQPHLPAALVMEDPGSVVSEAGFRNHLARALMEKHSSLFLTQVRNGQWPVGARHVSLLSDGSVLDVQPK